MFYIKKLYLFIFIFILSFTIYYVDRSKIIETFSNKKKYVYVLGDVVGIKASTDGVLVLASEDNTKYIDGLKEGDNILYIENQRIYTSQDISNILNKLKKDRVNISFERDGKITQKVIETKREGDFYKLGFWVRDKISGIGTMTCYDADKNKFYAIGHPICDMDTQEIIKIKEGSIYKLSEFKISKNTKGNIGKIEGEIDSKNLIGNFYKNLGFGIEGNLLENSLDIKESSLIEVGNFEEIEKKKAKILFKSQHGQLKYYDILINDLNRESKILEIEIIDKELIDFMGGIVQGMSGSPIIQDGKLVGAVTHVLADDPTKGYGIFIENILEAAG